jgi:hypothetical protein
MTVRDGPESLSAIAGIRNRGKPGANIVSKTSSVPKEISVAMLVLGR